MFDQPVTPTAKNRKTSEKNQRVCFRFRSLGLFRQLADEAPDERQSRSDLADILCNLGTLEHAERRLEQARTYFGESLVLSQQLAVDLPHDLKVQGDLMRLLEHLGYLELEAGRCGQARTHFEQRLGLARRWAAQRPDDVASQRDVALALIALGDADRQDDRRDVARQRYDESKEIILRLAAGLPDDVVDNDLAHLEERLSSTRPDDAAVLMDADAREDRWRTAKRLVESGEQHLKERDTLQAGRCFEEAREFLEQLADAWSDNMALRQDLARCCGRLVLLGLSEKRWDEARAYSEQSLTILESLTPGLPADQRELRHNYVQLGLLCLRAGRIEETRRLLGMELAICERLARAAPTDFRVQQEWAAALVEQGNLSMRQGDWQGAQEWFQQCLAIRERLAQAQPNDFQTLREWTEVVARSEHAVEADGDHEIDAECRNQLVKCDRLALEDPRRLLDQRDLMQNLALLGQGCFWSGELSNARRFFLVFVAIVDRVDRVAPNLPEVHQEWSAILSRLAAISLREGRGEEARRFLVQWLKLCERWAARAPNADAAASQWTPALEGVNVLGDQPNAQGQAVNLRHLQVKVSEVLVEATPDNAHAERELAFQLQLLAESQTLAPEARVAVLLDAIRRCEQLHENQPFDRVTGHVLAQACYQLGTLYRDGGQKQMARRYLARYKAVLREMQEKGITLEPHLEAAATQRWRRLLVPIHFLAAFCLIAFGMTISWLWSWAWLAGVPIAMVGCLVLAATVFRTGFVRIVPCPRCGADAVQVRGRVIRCSKCQ